MVAVERPRPTDSPPNVGRSGQGAVVPMTREVLHPSVRGEILHVVIQHGTRSIAGREQGGKANNLGLREPPIKEPDLINNPVESFHTVPATPEKLISVQSAPTADCARNDAIFERPDVCSIPR